LYRIGLGRIVAGADGMGEIIAFNARSRAAAPPPAPGGAKILFFLGVRYVRDAPTKGSPRDRGGGGKKKKRA
jgi:hypothetical protein